MDRPDRLRIATRIHYALLREVGTGIDIGAMLRQQTYAQEVIYVCKAVGDPELRELSLRFEALEPAAPEFVRDLVRNRPDIEAPHRQPRKSPTAHAARRHGRDFRFTPSRDAAASANAMRVRAAPVGTLSRPAWFGRVLFKHAH